MDETSADCHLRDGEGVPKCEGLVLHLRQAESVAPLQTQGGDSTRLLPSSWEGKSGPFV